MNELIAIQESAGWEKGKGVVRVVCMDLASVYRAIARKHFPNALIVADRFHVIRLINHHFLGCWREIDCVGSKNRGLLSLMRRHRHNLRLDQAQKLSSYLAERPALEVIYRFQATSVLSAAQKTPHS